MFNFNNIQIAKYSSKVELTTFAFSESGDNLNPSIATFAIENHKVYNNSLFFIKDIRANLNLQRQNPRVIIDDPVLLIPYYTTHFGHFTGECLGAIIALSKSKITNLNANVIRKLIYIAPNPFDQLIEQYTEKSKLLHIGPKVAQDNNLIFTNACMLPRLSAWQNLFLCTQIFSNVMVDNDSTKDFL
jgi:hypothetical protein